MAKDTTEEGLKQVIGVQGLAASIINGTLGAGIYVLPAIVSIQMGAAGILGYLFCGLMLITIMLCYVEIGSKVRTSGGSYVYVETAFGPFAGFLINGLYTFGWGIIGSAALMNVVADSLLILFPVFSNPLARAFLDLILLCLIVLVNVRSAKMSVRMLEYLTLVKLLPLLAIIIFGFSQVKMANLHWEHLPSAKSLGDTCLVLFFAFAGFETSLGASGEIKNSRRTIPVGILLGTAIVFIFYTLLQTVAQGALGTHMVQFKAAPLATIAGNSIGPAGFTVLLLAAVISSLGNVSNDVLATPRVLFACAKHGLFPKYLAKVHPRYATPHLAVITYASLIFLFSVSGGFEKLAVLASGSLLLVYMSVIFATIKLRLNKGAADEKGFKVPGGITIPVIAISAIGWLLAHLKFDEIKWTAVFIAGLAVVYLLMRWVKRKKAMIGIPKPASSQM